MNYLKEDLKLYLEALYEFHWEWSLLGVLLLVLMAIFSLAMFLYSLL